MPHFWNILYCRWKKTSDNRKFIVERHDIRSLRVKYLRAIKACREEGRPVVCVDETYIRRSADKSLARYTCRCRRRESIVSLERVVCPCADLQVFSCYRGWKEACQATRAISTTSRRELSSFFFCKARRRRKFTPFWQKHYGNMHHHMPPSKTG